jgi:hypothetical protein
MFKHTYYASILLFISLPILGMSSPDVYISTLTNQLNHVNAQIKAAKRAWNESRIRIELAKKTLQNKPALFEKLKQAFEKIIASDAFITTMNTTVNQQFDSIVNNNMHFNAIRTTNNLSDFYQKPISALGQQLYTAMANKAYFVLLGQKLAQKSKELAATIITLKRQSES